MVFHTDRGLSTGTRAPLVTSRKISGSASIGRATGEICVLHAPQRPTSASRSAGDRFFLPQEAHVRIIPSRCTLAGSARLFP
jgi:hypothetical protein